MTTSRQVQRLVEEQVAAVPGAARRDALRALLLAEPRREERDWDYGDAGERFPYWVVAESPERRIILVYCDQGFGPESPWGFLRTDAPGETTPEGTTLGMDAQWSSCLEEAFVRSGLGRSLPEQPGT